MTNIGHDHFWLKPQLNYLFNIIIICYSLLYLERFYLDLVYI